MFAISVKQQQYKTYLLTDSAAESVLEVVPERGGMITGWTVQGRDILYMDRERFAHPELSVRGGIPILFPICGNLPDSTYTHNGQTHKLKQHGFARDLPWEVSSRVTQECAGITLVLESSEITRAVYPFDFKLAFSYELKGNVLEIVQRYTNLSAEPMPFSTGLHPYFLVPDKSQLQFEIPAVQYTNQRTQTTHPFTGTFDFSDDEIDFAFCQLTGLAATVTDRSRRLRLTLSYHSIYSTVVFWTLRDKDFYCLEPWSASRNALNTGLHLIRLEPGATLQTLVRICAKFF